MNAGYFVLDRRVFDYLGGDDCIFEREPLERLANDGQLMAYRHDGFFYAMDTFREYQHSTSYGAASRRPGRSGREHAFWQDRPVLVTGATGLVGAGSPAACSKPAPTSSAWCATGCRRANWCAPAPCDRVKVVRGDIRDHRLSWSAPSASTRSTPSFTWPRRPSSASPTATRISTFESNIQGTWNLLEACRRSPLVEVRS